MNKIKALKTIIITAFLSIFLTSVSIYADSECEPNLANNFTGIAVIPKPMKMNLTGGSFTIKPKTIIYVISDSPEIYSIAKYFAGQIKPATGMKLSLLESVEIDPPAGSILFTTTAADKTLGAEGYELIVKPNSILVRAPYPEGLFYGIQTLRQLLPAQIESQQKADNAGWSIPCVRIMDKPRFQWRSFMLDSVRHFQTKEFIKRYIDLLAFHKMNRFHWHLNDDQGWRVEIKKYPKLTQIGAWRGEGKNRYGGFYTQQDIREIVAYAKSRYVTVVPEIEMPSHATVPLFCYPELSCTGGPFETGGDGLGYYTEKNGWLVYCAGNERTFLFLQNVLIEVIEMFDVPYIHIGGEELREGAWTECPKCQAKIKELGLTDESQLHNWFMSRISSFIANHNRRAIAFSDKNMNHGVPANQIVQGWHPGWVEFAAERGFESYNSNLHLFYLNYPSSEEDRTKRSDYPDWMDTITLQKIYSSDPEPNGLTIEQAMLILGGEACLWTELVSQERVDEKVFPRLTAMAEILWSSKELRNWEDFSSRLDIHYQRLDKLGVNYLRPLVSEQMIAEK